ncbi:ESX secretion-associated protein EspG [Millisia brevis]|uniref:ESX secretion-associated protein EspG n=1 Tax=Millisia brevis TaxID=264148 RepID=UPI000833FF32|nr:ESX secretion-associated protein EspG [Millisia brevis]
MIWALSPDHFALAWATTGHDTFPPPLRVQPTARTVEDRRAQEVALTNWWRQTPTRDDFEGALRALAHPTVRVEVYGDVDGPVRVLAAADAVTAVVVSQEPGPDPSTGGAIQLRTAGVGALADTLVSVLPARAPGRPPAVTAGAAELRASTPTSFLYDPFLIPDAQRLRRLLHSRRDGTGHLLIRREDDHRDGAAQVLSWIDVVDDGRYLVRAGTDVECLPATTADFVDLVTRLIDDVSDPAPTARQITSM